MSEFVPTIDTTETAVAFDRIHESIPARNGHEELHREAASQSKEIRLLANILLEVLEGMARRPPTQDKAQTPSATPADTGDSAAIDHILETSDLGRLREIKSKINAREKVLTNGRCYKRRVRKGREYWYEVVSDPENGKKKDRYVGHKPPVGSEASSPHA
jgi:hypothetical protein